MKNVENLKDCKKKLELFIKINYEMIDEYKEKMNDDNANIKELNKLIKVCNDSIKYSNKQLNKVNKLLSKYE